MSDNRGEFDSGEDGVQARAPATVGTTAEDGQGPRYGALTGVVVTSSRVRKRSLAYIYYGIVALICLIGTVSAGPVALLVAALMGGYAIYLYRGGRIVIWFW